MFVIQPVIIVIQPSLSVDWAQPTQGLKNIQDFTKPGAKGAGEPTPEAAMAKKKKGIKDARSMKEREEKKKAKAAEKVCTSKAGKEEQGEGSAGGSWR